MSSRKVRIVFATLGAVTVTVGAVTLFGTRIRGFFGATSTALAGGESAASHAYDANVQTYYGDKCLSNFGHQADPPAPYAERPPPPPRSAGTAYTPAVHTPAAAPALRAGRHDDNDDYDRFLAFLGGSHPLIPVDVRDRLVIRTVDADGRPLANCRVRVASAAGRELALSTTYADGRTQFFPAGHTEPDERGLVVKARCGQATLTSQATRGDRHDVRLQFDARREVAARVPVDIGIVIDTTGSMGGQIDRLKQTLRAIHHQLTRLYGQPDIRFGLVAYRDRGDVYLTKVTDFTSSVSAFQSQIDALHAAGGGDLPEDVQEGLNQALHALSWRDDAIRVAFLIGDAPPHVDYGETFTYREAMREALSRGIKIVGVGVGGLDLQAETVWRQLAQYTMAEYVFVTTQGGDDTDGRAAEASHHVGANYQVENLDQAIVRIVRHELSHQTDETRLARADR